MIDAIFQVGEQNKINNLLNIWEACGLKGEFHKVTNSQQLRKQTNKTKFNKDKIFGIKNLRTIQEHR